MPRSRCEGRLTSTTAASFPVFVFPRISIGNPSGRHRLHSAAGEMKSVRNLWASVPARRDVRQMPWRP